MSDCYSYTAVVQLFDATIPHPGAIEELNTYRPDSEVTQVPCLARYHSHVTIHLYANSNEIGWYY